MLQSAASRSICGMKFFGGGLKSYGYCDIMDEIQRESGNIMKRIKSTLQDYLGKIFTDSDNVTLPTDEKERAEYDAFFDNYKMYLPAEQIASEV